MAGRETPRVRARKADVPDTEPARVLARVLDGLPRPLDRVHRARVPGERKRQVAEARVEFEDLLRPREFGEFEHQRNEPFVLFGVHLDERTQRHLEDTRARNRVPDACPAREQPALPHDADDVPTFLDECGRHLAVFLREAPFRLGRESDLVPVRKIHLDALDEAFRPRNPLLDERQDPPERTPPEKALRDGYELVGSGGKITDSPSFHAEAEPPAVLELPGGRNDRADRRALEAADPAEKFAHEFFFGAELDLVPHVLPGAPPAPGKVRTGRQPARGPGLEESGDLGKGIGPAIFANRELHQVAGRRLPDEMYLAVHAGHGVGPVGKAFDSRGHASPSLPGPGARFQSLLLRPFVPYEKSSPMPGSDLRIRRARRADFDGVSRILERVGGSPLPPDRRTIRRFRRIVADLGSDLYVAEKEGRLLGFVYVRYSRHLAHGSQARVEQLVVEPGSEESRVRDELLGLALRRARKRDCTSLHATTRAVAPAREDWLRTSGLVPDGTDYRFSLDRAP